MENRNLGSIYRRFRDVVEFRNPVGRFDEIRFESTSTSNVGYVNLGGSSKTSLSSKRIGFSNGTNSEGSRQVSDEVIVIVD